MIFEDLEDENNKDKKLSILERSLIVAAIPLAKLLLWKIRRAKTYGDLMGIAYIIQKKMDGIDEKYGDDASIKDESSVDIAIAEMGELEEELKKEQ